MTGPVEQQLLLPAKSVFLQGVLAVSSPPPATAFSHLRASGDPEWSQNSTA